MSQSDESSKKEKLRAAVQERVNKEEHAYRLVEKMVLLDSVDKEFFLNAGKYITISQYKDVTEERAITKLCGFALCNNRITQVLKQKYKISVKEKKVYDLTERKNFCSNKCYKASKYFESQLSSEPVWMRERNKSTGLKLLEDGEERMQKYSGSGEEVLISGEEVLNPRGNDDKCEHVQTKHELAETANAHSDSENEHDHEHENQNYGYENHNYQHENPSHERENLGGELEDQDVDNEHENCHDENEDYNERECFDSNHEYHNIHKHIQFGNNDLGSIVERTGNVKIDLDFTDSDDDLIDDDIDNIDDDNCVKSEEKIGNSGDKIEQNSETSVVHNVKSSAMLENISIDQEQPQKDLNSDQTNNSEQEQTKKLCIEKVHEVLQEWCGIETKSYLRKSFNRREMELLHDKKRSSEVVQERGRRKDSGKSVLLPSIDSKSQMAIRGKIVSDKLTKAMSPMLSKLSLTKADVSSQLTNMLKTFRFTNTNIVLKPPEWTLVALTLLLVLVKFDLSLTRLLSSRQKDLHLLLSNTIDDEDDVDRLLDVFNFEGGSESAVLDGQQKFDMEELD